MFQLPFSHSERNVMKLIIAEKPSVAKEIANVVGADKRQDGFYEGSSHFVSWCYGHLIELYAPEDYDESLKKWSLNTLPILPERFQTKVSAGTAKQFHVLKKLMGQKEVEELVCATDAGREGELIFRLVYEQASCTKPWKRLWVSSMEHAAIRDALENMKDGHAYDNLGAAAKCRQQADWLMGMNLTRLYSQKYNQRLNTGRVQTPTINLVVRRQEEIEGFRPVPYYPVTAHLPEFGMTCRCEDKQQAQQLVEYGKDAGEIVMKEVKREQKTTPPPRLYDLTTLQRDANRLLGYTAQQTLDIVQNLYESKLCTYPRTDSQYITADMQGSTNALLSRLGDAFLSTEQVLDAQRLVNDSKVTDHHAIIPTASFNKEKLSGLSAPDTSIMLLLLYRLLAAAGKPESYAVATATAELDGMEFKATGRTVLDAGHTATLMDMRRVLRLKETQKRETVLPEGLREHAVYPIASMEVQEKFTEPPKPYTEDTLLAAMETCGKKMEEDALRDAMKDSGLGTPATRASILESIVKNGFAEREKKNLRPTEKARCFMTVVDSAMKSPETTALWEKQLAEIQQGKSTAESFMADIRRSVSAVVQNEKLNTGKENPFPSEKKAVGICPLCGKNVVEMAKSYSCESGREGCGFVLWKQIAGKTLGQQEVQDLLTKRKTKLLSGFTSKAGKTFSAYLLLKENKVGFEFPQKKGT